MGWDGVEVEGMGLDMMILSGKLEGKLPVPPKTLPGNSTRSEIRVCTMF